MSNEVGKPERETQNRIIKLFNNELEYDYLGNWEHQERRLPIETNLLYNFLTQQQGYSAVLANKAIDVFTKTASDLTNGLYNANKEVYTLLRYGIPIKEEVGMNKDTVWLINWDEPLKNHFAIAEEVTVKGKTTKRPDIVIYVNGIALGVLELKKSKNGVTQGIRQNLFNQKPELIEQFFTTMQLVLAGNDSQGLRYGTIETKEKHYLTWKEECTTTYEYVLDKHLSQLCEKERFLELIHDFVVFDGGVKKLCRPNQFFGIKAAHQHVRNKEGGIIWHTQGSGKSLTMVWLTKWIRENIIDSRVLIITDREELDDQIEKLFIGVEENIYRTKNSNDLLDVLNRKQPWLICSLIHKFGGKTEDESIDAYIQDLKSSLASDFKAKGNIHVFVDECHRTQSGKLHEAMKAILPDAMFIGFTGTPLLKKDKQKSIEIFGPYIGNPYKFDEAIEDGVVLDLLYEARDVEQFVTDQQSIDEWFEAETQGLTDVAKTALMKKWGTMQKVLGSKTRLEKIVYDILKDFKTTPRLKNGAGNAILVSGSIYQACKYYELFQSVGFKECAIITSYTPTLSDIKEEETGEGALTEKLLQYNEYKKMLNGKTPEQFEAEVKTKFKKEPAKMKLLIVVDKLLTGFDAPSCTYLYIDKNMQDHGLFQAICRVNRVHTEDKDYGFIIDYKDLFKSLNKSIKDYTSGEFDAFDKNDVNGLLVNRLEKIREDLDIALDAVKAICEPVHPKDEPTFQRYFCGDSENRDDLDRTEEKRVAFYKATAKLIRAYSNIANEMEKAGYSTEQTQKIKEEVKYYSELRDTIKNASGDHVDLKRFEPGMRQLMDMYISANSSKKISNFENKTLVQLIRNISEDEAINSDKRKQGSMSESIENNIRRLLVEQKESNPKYYERMSALLEDLIKQRKASVLAYKEYLDKIAKLAEQIEQPGTPQGYPTSLTSKGKQALYDNLDQDLTLALAVDNIIQSTKLDGWRGSWIKEKKLELSVNEALNDEERAKALMEIIKKHDEY